MILILIDFNFGISSTDFIDSTKIAVCHNLYIPRHRVFERVAQQGKTSTGWFLWLFKRNRG